MTKLSKAIEKAYAEWRKTPLTYASHGPYEAFVAGYRAGRRQGKKEAKEEHREIEAFEKAQYDIDFDDL